MNITELAKHGVDASLIEIWRNCGHERLLPIQQIAVQRYNLFGGESLLVSAPTSSGKTFIGEMATGNVITGGSKAFYLVPLKALATEKFETFRERYAPLGSRVVISTRDYREYDTAIENHQFEIAVVVYEKMQQILTRKPGVLQGMGLIVADEIQMLADRERGADLEVLLTRLKTAPVRFQLVGLSAVLRDNDILSRWLGARFLEHYERPVELRRGIVFQGEFEYQTYNTHTVGTETLPGVHEGPAWKIIMSTAVQLAERGEQSLIFLSDKDSTRRMATLATEEFHGRPAANAIEQLMSLEETRSRQMLVECLQSGMAFHNADMSIEERTVVERYFREGDVRIICATPTLAVGVNLPARNVFLEPMLWDSNKAGGQLHKRYLTKAEYDNMGGRAGRLSLEDEFGRSVLVATTPLERMVLRKRYFESELEPIAPQLSGIDLDTHVMNLVAAEAAFSRDEIAKFLAQTYTGVTFWRTLTEQKEEFQRKINVAVGHCVEYGLLTDEGGRLEASSLGRLCAVKGIAAQSGHVIRRWLDAIKGRGVTEIEAIYALCRTHEARQQHVNMSTQEYHAWVYPDRLAARLPREAFAFFGQVLEDRIYQTYDKVREMKVALLLADWVEGHKAVDIEEEYQSLAGTIRAAGETCGWLADAAAAIAELLGLPADDVRFLQALSTRLTSGVPSTGVDLCRIRLHGFGRTHVQKLLNAGLADMQAVRNAPGDVLKRALGSKMGARLRKYLDSGCAAHAEPPPEELPMVEEAASQTPGTFHSADQFHFDATPCKRRTLILANGVRHEIPNKTFGILLRMAIQLQLDGVGWLRREAFGENPQQAISHVRNDTRAIISDPQVDIIENDAFGSYRLSVPPQNVTFDWENIRAHWDHQIAAQAKLMAETAATK